MRYGFVKLFLQKMVKLQAGLQTRLCRNCLCTLHAGGIGQATDGTRFPTVQVVVNALEQLAAVDPTVLDLIRAIAVTGEMGHLVPIALQMLQHRLKLGLSVGQYAEIVTEQRTILVLPVVLEDPHMIDQIDGVQGCHFIIGLPDRVRNKFQRGR